jgi:signal transduction histidine kinase
LGDPERRARALPEYKWQELANTVALFRRAPEDTDNIGERASNFRAWAHAVTLALVQITPGSLPREPIRELLQLSSTVERSACLIDILITRTTVIQMDASLRALREFITSDIRHEKRVRLPVKSLVEQAVTQMTEFAKRSRVDIVWRDRDIDVEVEGTERDLKRALANLLHNAIKYTWRRDRTRAPWITIRTALRDRMVCIEFENWGVPIEREEIDQGLIFQLGYRGEWSKDRGRLGTGIGLTDAKRVAEAHGGQLYVDSHPTPSGVRKTDSPEYYNQPFITTVTLCLPYVKAR